MKTFSLHLESPSRYEKINDVASCVGLDATGTFGILANHERMMTILLPGTLRIRKGDGSQLFIGTAGGVLYFVKGELFISTNRYVTDANYEELSRQIRNQIEAETEDILARRQTIHQMEEELLRQLLRPERVGRW